MDPSKVLLTAADVDGWRADKVRLEAEIAERQKRLGEIDVKLNAATVFMAAIDGHAGSPDDAAESHAADEDRETLSAGVLKVLAGAKKPIAPTAIRNALMSTDHADQIKRNPSYIYNVISRLFRSEKIVRHRGGRYALPVQYSPPVAGMAGVTGPRLVSLEPRVEAVEAARKAGGT